jgi:hypothetical protein
VAKLIPQELDVSGCAQLIAAHACPIPVQACVCGGTSNLRMESLTSLPEFKVRLSNLLCKRLGHWISQVLCASCKSTCMIRVSNAFSYGPHLAIATTASRALSRACAISSASSSFGIGALSASRYPLALAHPGNSHFRPSCRLVVYLAASASSTSEQAVSSPQLTGLSPRLPV